jgi:hypothetical protein
MIRHHHIHQQLQVQVFQPEGPTPAHPQSQYRFAPHPCQSEVRYSFVTCSCVPCLISTSTQPLTTQGGANQVHATLPSATPSSSPNQVALPGTPTDAWSRCPVCGRKFRRPQERNRHICTSLPHFLFCPILFCAWRGNRSENLNSHWVTTHADLGAAPKPEDCMIYDPNPLAEKVVSGELLIESVEAIALQMVESRAQELGKVPYGQTCGAANRGFTTSTGAPSSFVTFFLSNYCASHSIGSCSMGPI